MSLYGFLIGIAFVVGAQYFSQKNKIISKDKENIFILFLFIVSIIGARIYSVISDWSYYSQNLNQIINTRNGGLGIYGGLLASLFYVYIFAKKNKYNFVDIINTIVPIVPLGQSIGRWGNFVNKEVFGIPTYTNFGQYIPQNLRPEQFQNFSYFHPVWLYESLLDLLLFLILIKTKKNQLAYYLIGYGTIRFLMEFLRWDTFSLNHVKVAQVVSLIFITIGTLMIINRTKTNS